MTVTGLEEKPNPIISGATIRSKCACSSGRMAYMSNEEVGNPCRYSRVLPLVALVVLSTKNPIVRQGVGGTTKLKISLAKVENLISFVLEILAHSLPLVNNWRDGRRGIVEKPGDQNGHQHHAHCQQLSCDFARHFLYRKIFLFQNSTSSFVVIIIESFRIFLHFLLQPNRFECIEWKLFQTQTHSGRKSHLRRLTGEGAIATQHTWPQQRHQQSVNSGTTHVC